MRSGVATALLLTVLLAPGKAPAAASSALYDAHCALCHQRAAAGAPGQFPRLAGRVAAIAANPDGRAYLVGVVRNGLSGSLELSGPPRVRNHTDLPTRKWRACPSVCCPRNSSLPSGSL
jgi:hypothetical protein